MSQSFLNKSSRYLHHLVWSTFVVLFALLSAACGARDEAGRGIEAEGTAAQVASEETSESAVPPAEDADPRALAHAVYERVFAQQPVTPLLADVFDRLEMEVLDPELDQDLIRARIDGEQPFLLLPQLELLADGFTFGLMVDLTSFVEEINAKGYRPADGSGMITREYLTDRLMPLTSQDMPEDQDFRVALALALGRERAARLEIENPDPLWGDDRLDPLQVTLLTYELVDIASEATASRSSLFASVITAALPLYQAPPWDSSLDLVGGLLEAPEAICTHAILYSHRAKLQLSPRKIYRRGSGNARPHESNASFRLTFKLHPAFRDHRWLLEALCPEGVPEDGARSDVRVEWTISENWAPGNLRAHGRLTEQTTSTMNGVARTTFQAYDETLPESFRKYEVEAGGSIVAKARGLVENSPLVLEIEQAPNEGESLWIATNNLTVGRFVGGGAIEMALTMGESDVHFTWQEATFTVLDDGTITGQGEGTVSGTAYCQGIESVGPIFNVSGAFTYDVDGRIVNELEATYVEFVITDKITEEIAFSYDDPECEPFMLNDLAKWNMTLIIEKLMLFVPGEKFQLPIEDGAVTAYDLPDVGVLLVSLSAGDGESP